RSAPSYVPLEANVGERVRLILANIGFELHTPHLHGQNWLEVNSGNLRSPVMDNPNGVVAIGPAEIKIVEFVPKYAGTWLFHCHVVPHVADDGKYPRGMLTLFQISDEKTPPISQS
ncbi:MAG: multicopper oxidase domain-containing protein, partial [Deltaproteobacteria bacterium]|nr:multicopper oxidase domain-containing protein [Deltaproteobacteria bacterium]